MGKKPTFIGDGNGDGSPSTSRSVRVKLGSASMSIYLHPEDPMEIGELIRYKKTPWEPWDRWSTAYVHGVIPLPILERI